MLTEQNKEFIHEYVKQRCKNATLAAIKVGYSEKTASSQASMLLKKTEVQEYLKKEKEKLNQELREDFLFDALEARKIMYDIMNNPEASDRDKLTACKEFLDRAGFKPEDVVSINGNVNVKNPYDELSVEELKALAKKCEADD